MAKDPTHLDQDGTARMVDVSSKPTTTREAVAVSFVYLSASTYDAVRQGNSKKGDILSTARLAGIMGAKRTGELIPLCHPLGLAHVDVRFSWLPKDHALAVRCSAVCAGQTGVEMEAIMGASIASLTVYDMVKAIDRGVVIGDAHVLSKSGGKSGTWTHESPPGPDLREADWV